MDDYDEATGNDELPNSSKFVKFSNLCNLLEKISKSQGAKGQTRFDEKIHQ